MAHYKRNKKLVTRHLMAERALGSEIESSGIVTAFDDTDFEAGKCCNGGHYRFWIEYQFIGNSTWKLVFGNSSDFESCSNCGDFARDRHEGLTEDGDGWESYCPVKTISTMELVHELKRIDSSTRACNYYPEEKAEYWRL